MKKFVLILFILPFITVQAQSEPLPDGSFDKWTTGTTHELHPTHPNMPYDKLADTFWETLNFLATLPPELSTGPIVFWKDQGLVNYAPKATSNTLELGEAPIFLPGVFGTITIDVEKQTAYFGRPYTSRPDSLVGYIKYKPVANDSAAIFMEFYQSASGMRRVLYSVKQTFHGEINEWTRFSIPITLPEGAIPDSATVLFVASADYNNFVDLFKCKGSLGSTIWADECKFIFNNQASTESVETVRHNALVYPNPTNGDVFVKTQIPVKNARIEILDIRGSVVKSQELNGTNTSLDLRSLKSALYMYRIIDDGKVIESGRINLIK